MKQVKCKTFEVGGFTLFDFETAQTRQGTSEAVHCAVMDAGDWVYWFGTITDALQYVQDRMRAAEWLRLSQIASEYIWDGTNLLVYDIFEEEYFEPEQNRYYPTRNSSIKFERSERGWILRNRRDIA